MATSRRNFLNLSGLAIGAFGLGAVRSIAAGSASAPGSSQPRDAHEPEHRSGKAPKPLRILILGGTGFIGPHEVRYALARGHKVTLFNRGRTNPGLFPEVERLQGDRAVGDYTSLKGRDWDAVIDNPTTLPRWVRQAVDSLRNRVKQYVF